MTGRIPVIAIDGPSSSGKGTISRGVARRLGWHLLDSGALYRLVGLAAARAAIPLDAPTGLVALAEVMEVRFGNAEAAEQIWLDGADVTAEIRSEQAGAAASRVAVIPELRRALLQRQRDFARLPGLVADGRDMGTVVFPDAGLKVFLTASTEERAMRRYKQLKGKGIDVSLPDLSRDIEQRDARDANRSTAPLRPATDARVLDSTALTPEEVIACILKWFEAAGT